MNQVIELIRDLSKEELHAIYHSSGLERSRTIYRTHYCTYTDDAILNGLVGKGCFVGPQHIEKNAYGTDKSSGYYYLTKLGKQVAITIKRGQNSNKSTMLKNKD